MDVFDRTEDRSVLNLVPASVQACFIKAQQAHPDLFLLDEADLYKKLKPESMQPTPTDNRIRLAFWLEYERAQQNQAPMEMAYVYGGVCVKQYFYGTYLKSPTRVAWMLCPPTGYQVILEESVAFGAQRMREYMALDPVLPSGKLDHKLIELQAKIYAMMEQRLKGGITQRVEQKTLQITGQISEKQAMQAITDNSMEAMERRLKELEKRERKALNMPEVRVVDAGKS